MNVELRAISTIRPYENNPRQNDDAVDAVAASIREFGFRQPIVVDEQGVIIVGHTRFKASLKLGLTEVPVHVATGLSPAQVRAYRIADNQTATLSSWDDDKLPLELLELQQLDFDLNLTGFSADDLLSLLEPPPGLGLTDPDDVPLPPDQATTRPRDLWRLGSHRLHCGDAAKPDDVDRLLGGAPIHLANSDPPYNVKVEPRSNGAIAAGLSSFPASRPSSPARSRKLRARDRPVANDSMSDEAYAQLLRAWFGNIARVLVPGRAFYLWGGYSNLDQYPPALRECGLYFSQAIVWDKQHPVVGRKDFMGCFELAYYGWREGAAHQFFGPNNAPDLWAIQKVNTQSRVHLTEKPVELARRAIEYSSKRGENVLDLFAGSGSTLIAAEQAGRRAYLMELDPLYCDIIVQRFEQFTGKQAERVAPAQGAVEKTARPTNSTPREVTHVTNPSSR